MERRIRKVNKQASLMVNAANKYLFKNRVLDVRNEAFVIADEMLTTAMINRGWYYANDEFEEVHKAYASHIRFRTQDKTE